MSSVIKVSLGARPGQAQVRRDDERSVRTLMSKADAILKKTDESHIFKATERRLFPTFEKSEVKIGQILGSGGFCVVREVIKFDLRDHGSHETTVVSTTPATEELEKSDSSNPDTKQEDTEKQEGQKQDNNNEKTQPTVVDNNTNTRRQIEELKEEEHHSGDDDHYAVETAREQMVQRCLCDGNSRYAVKRLRRDLSPMDLARAMIDLSIEAKFLSALWHPNIVKMRGLAKEEATMTIDYFIIMDRLYGTLLDKMGKWILANAKASGILGIGRNKMMLNDLLVQRLLVAYDLAAALRYIHDQRLVYRDIKPENIGFDIRGDVKLFDFGLCKSLEPELKVRGGYLLTGRTGSIPYMAPEVGLGKPYDNKCDVFSFAILLWEILAIKASFKNMSKKEYFNRVMNGNERPPIQKNWPPLTRAMMKVAWDPLPSKRPDMKSIATLIRSDLNDMSKDETVLHRTQHMADRSQHSLSGRIQEWQKTLNMNAKFLKDPNALAREGPSRELDPREVQVLMSRAEAILKKTEESHVFTTTERRHFPTFAKSELEIGHILGTGGFCLVREVTKFALIHDSSHENNHDEKKSENGVVANDNDKLPDRPKDEEHRGDDDHYEVETAREKMVQRCSCDGNARYAVKRLRRDLSPAELARGKIDLAIEAKFLSVLWHPNIVKMRGLAMEEAVLTVDYFIILDRLYGTLNERLRKWLLAINKASGMFGLGKNKMMLNDLMVERLLVAYDLAAALRYIHEQRLVYRDIKPENIGFDIRGDVKLFDFGLCKSLEPELKVRGGYLLTGRTGSIPYMAPEVALSKPYDSKCDVFSFAILLWEILAIKAAFKTLTKKEYLNQVMMGTVRPPIHKSWPPLTRAMMKAAWDPDPYDRPDMKNIATLIRTDLNDMSNDESVLHRTQHMVDRSQHSDSGRRPVIESKDAAPSKS